ncbi:sushi, nidogen and EGF-like domain-containing protein 1 [Dysidea avara]|uniref:sushi, nidogen and EGF-like domain-containing protein 1 n=1 Tax=Dysidea avara TaxID=196820 RepID=UPI0033326B3A
MVAPYWADVDTRGTGNVFYRQTTDPSLLARATSEIRAAFPRSINVTITNLVIATWDAVGYFSLNIDKTNTFQCVLATDGVESFVIFLYAHGRIQWTTGDASDGLFGLGGTEALAGINVGNGVTSETITGSRTSNIINIAETSNVGIPGVYIYEVSTPVAVSSGGDGSCGDDTSSLFFRIPIIGGGAGGVIFTILIICCLICCGCCCRRSKRRKHPISNGSLPSMTVIMNEQPSVPAQMPNITADDAVHTVKFASKFAKSFL